MRSLSVWAQLLNVAQTVIEAVDLDSQEAVLVVSVRPRRGQQRRCGLCGRRAPFYDPGDGRRRWRALDLGSTMTYLEANAPRVNCSQHGVIVAAVPWARHGSGFTRSFEDQTAWLVTHCSESAVAQLMRVTWRTVGRIIARVVEEAQAGQDRLAGLTQIGIDEVSFRKGQRYLTVVVDHLSRRLVWAAEGRDMKVLQRFFDELGKERSAGIAQVSCDAASWITEVVEKNCPAAAVCLDPFHVVSWATQALDQVRRQVWNEARRAGLSDAAKALKAARWAVCKNPQNLTPKQQAKLASIAKTNRSLYRAYLLKEQFRQIFQLPLDQAIALLQAWLAWARRSRLKPFVKLAKTIRHYQQGIEATLLHNLSNARVESTNTKIRLITRRAFGFHSSAALIALADLSLGGLCPALPGRSSDPRIWQ